MTVLIGLTGHKGSGKDTAANALDGFVNIKMAGALKSMLSALLAYQGAGDDYIQDCLEGDLKEKACPYLGGRTPRHAMQTLGTEWGREMMDPDLWVDATERRIGLFDKVCVSDVRFPNEVDMVKRLGGHVHRIRRLNLADADKHVSEAGIDYLAVDGEIFNDSVCAEAFGERARGWLT